MSQKIYFYKQNLELLLIADKAVAFNFRLITFVVQCKFVLLTIYIISLSRQFPFNILKSSLPHIAKGYLD